MVGCGDILVYGVLLSDAVGVEVSSGGQGVVFGFENESSDVLGVKLDNHR